MAQKSMTPSKMMTVSQIDKILGNLRARLISNSTSEFGPFISVDAAQKLIGYEGFIWAFQDFIQEQISFITYEPNILVTIDPDQMSPMEMIEATERRRSSLSRQLRDKENEVLASIPRSSPGKVRVKFFTPARQLTQEDLAHEYQIRNLKPADFYSVCAAIIAKPDFADDRPFATEWQDSEGMWVSISFNWDEFGRYVSVHRSKSSPGYRCWYHNMWFAGIAIETDE